MAGYPVPAGPHRQLLEVKRSRFITSVARADDPPAALSFIDQIRAEFPDASHHCYAYRAGPPGDSSRIGMSDAGEPRGTAGRPMLTVVLHADIGDVVVVVSRYFGGTKLGTGGLLRAYSNAVQQALESLPVVAYQPTAQFQLVADYAQHDALVRWLGQHQGQVLESEFGAQVTLTVSLPVAQQADFQVALESLGVLARQTAPP